MVSDGESNGTSSDSIIDAEWLIMLQHYFWSWFLSLPDQFIAPEIQMKWTYLSQILLPLYEITSSDSHSQFKSNNIGLMVWSEFWLSYWWNTDSVINETIIRATPLPYTETGGNPPHKLSIWCLICLTYIHYIVCIYTFYSDIYVEIVL